MSCSQVQAQLEAFIDAALPEADQQQIARHVQDCAACQAEWKLAQRIQQTLNALPEQRCPDNVTEAALGAARRQRIARWREGLAHIWRRKRLWRPVLAGASLAAVVLLLLLQLHWRQPSMPAVDPEEIARAELDVKWTLAYLGNLGKKTGASVRDQVLEPEVVEPLQHALRTIVPAEREQ